MFPVFSRLHIINLNTVFASKMNCIVAPKNYGCLSYDRLASLDRCRVSYPTIWWQVMVILLQVI